MASAGACSAAVTITRTCSTRTRPAANASRVAAYLVCNNPASHNPPAACSWVETVNRASQASVPVSPVCSATRRRSASAETSNRNAAARDSSRASSATTPPSASPVSPASPSTAASPARARHPAASATSSANAGTHGSTAGAAGIGSSIVMAIPI